jgi:hypothetical protein
MAIRCVSKRMGRGLVRGARSTRLPLSKTLQRSCEIGGQSDKRNLEPSPPPNQHIIAAGTQGSRGRKPHDFPQLPAQAITLDRITYFA